ncbi:MAG: hypothetical protein WDW36_000250 [Sanguina aurantia]
MEGTRGEVSVSAAADQMKARTASVGRTGPEPRVQGEEGHAGVLLLAAAPSGSDAVTEVHPNHLGASRLVPTAVSPDGEAARSRQEASGSGGDQAFSAAAECSRALGMQQTATPGTGSQPQRLNPTAADPVPAAGSSGTQSDSDLSVTSGSSLPAVVDIQRAVQQAPPASQQQRDTTPPLATPASCAALQADEPRQTAASSREPAALTPSPGEAAGTTPTSPQGKQQRHAQQQPQPQPQQEQVLLDETDLIPSHGRDVSMGGALPIPPMQPRSRLSFEQVMLSAWRALLQYLPFVPRLADHAAAAAAQHQPGPGLPATPPAQPEAQATAEVSRSHQPAASGADVAGPEDRAGLAPCEAAATASQGGVCVAGAAPAGASAVDGDQQDLARSPVTTPTSVGRRNASLHASHGEHQPQPSPSLPSAEDEPSTGSGVAAALSDPRHHSPDSSGVHAAAMDAVQQVLALQHSVGAQLDSDRLSSQAAARDSLLQLWLQQQALMAAAQSSSDQALAVHVLIAGVLVGQPGRAGAADASQQTPLLGDPQRLHIPPPLVTAGVDGVTAADSEGDTSEGAPVREQGLDVDAPEQRDPHAGTTGPMALQGGESALPWHQQQGAVQQSGQQGVSLPLEAQTAQGSEQPQVHSELTATGSGEPLAGSMATEWAVDAPTERGGHSSRLWCLIVFLILPGCLACLQTLISVRANAGSALRTRTAVDALQAAHEAHISELMSDTTARFSSLHRQHAEQRVSDLQASHDADARRSEERAAEAGRLASSRQEVLRGLRRESDLSNSADEDRTRFRARLEGVQAVAAAGVAAAVAEAAAADARAGDRQELLQRAHGETVRCLGRELVRVRVALVFAQREVVRGTRAWLELRQTVDAKLKLLMGRMAAQASNCALRDQAAELHLKGECKLRAAVQAQVERLQALSVNRMDQVEEYEERLGASCSRVSALESRATAVEKERLRLHGLVHTLQATLQETEGDLMGEQHHHRDLNAQMEEAEAARVAMASHYQVLEQESSDMKQAVDNMQEVYRMVPRLELMADEIRVQSRQAQEALSQKNRAITAELLKRDAALEGKDAEIRDTHRKLDQANQRTAISERREDASRVEAALLDGEVLALQEDLKQYSRPPLPLDPRPLLASSSGTAAGFPYPRHSPW